MGGATSQGAGRGKRGGWTYVKWGKEGPSEAGRDYLGGTGRGKVWAELCKVGQGGTVWEGQGHQSRGGTGPVKGCGRSPVLGPGGDRPR